MIDKKYGDAIRKYFGGKSPWSGMNNTQKTGAAMGAIGGALNVAAMIGAEHNNELAQDLNAAGSALGAVGGTISGIGDDYGKSKKTSNPGPATWDNYFRNGGKKPPQYNTTNTKNETMVPVEKDDSYLFPGMKNNKSPWGY